MSRPRWALAVWGDGLALLAAGDFDLVRVELDSVTVPTNSPESMQLAGMLALCRSLVAAADRRPADVDAALDYAGELAQRTGEGNAYWLGFGPTNVDLWRMAAALEAGDTPTGPGKLRTGSTTAVHWCRTEALSPLHTLRNPFVREVLGELLARSPG